MLHVQCDNAATSANVLIGWRFYAVSQTSSSTLVNWYKISKQNLMKELGSCPTISSQVCQKTYFFLTKETPAMHISISYCFLWHWLDLVANFHSVSSINATDYFFITIA